MSPWPGKCLPIAITPRACIPSMKAAPSSATRAGSEPNERVPMTGLAGLILTSRSGARSMLIPTADNSSAIAAPTRLASAASPVAAIAIALGNSTKPRDARKRVTAPPSWSMLIIKVGSPTARAAAWVSEVNWARSWGVVVAFRSNNTSPPGCRSAMMECSSSVTVMPSKPSINTWPAFCSRVIAPSRRATSVSEMGSVWDTLHMVTRTEVFA